MGTNNRSFWSFLNSPFVILLLIFSAGPFIFAFAHSIAAKWKYAVCLKETQQLIQNLDDPKQTGTIRLLVSSVFSQISSGMIASFSQVSNEQTEKTIRLTNVLAQIQVSDVQVLATAWSAQQKIIGKITNHSDQTAQNIRLNLMYFDSNTNLIDADVKWLSDLKFLSPNQSFAFAIDHSLGDYQTPKEELENRKAKWVEVRVVYLDLLEMQKKP